VAAVAVLGGVLTWQEEEGSPWEQGWALLLVMERGWEWERVSVQATRWEQVLGWLPVSKGKPSALGNPAA
jgi:hypothetical protein